MSRVKRDFEVSLAGWRLGNIGSLLYRQAIRRRVNYLAAALMSSAAWPSGEKMVEPCGIEPQTFALRTSLFWLFFTGFWAF